MKNFTIYTFLFQLSLFFILPQVKFIYLSWNAIISSDDGFFKKVLSRNVVVIRLLVLTRMANPTLIIAGSTLSFLSNYRAVISFLKNPELIYKI